MFVYKKQLVIALVLSLSLVFIPARSAHAVWTENFLSQTFKQTLEEAARYIEGVQLAALKVAAFQTIERHVSNIISGGSAQDVKFITDWEEFLIEEPEKKADAYLNDFFTQTLRGMSGSGYESAQVAKSPFGEGGSLSYPQYLKERAEAAILGDSKGYNLPCDPSQMFASGDWHCWHVLMSGDYTPDAYTQLAQEAYQDKLVQERLEAQTKAIANEGYKAVEKTITTIDGQKTIVQTPGVLIASIEKSVYDTLFKFPFEAENLAEFVTLSAATVVNNMVSDVMNRAITRVNDAVSDNIQKEKDAIEERIGPIAQEIPSFKAKAEDVTKNPEWVFVEPSSP